MHTFFVALRSTRKLGMKHLEVKADSEQAARTQMSNSKLFPARDWTIASVRVKTA